MYKKKIYSKKTNLQNTETASAFDLSNAVNKRLLGSAAETKYPFKSIILGVAPLPPLTTNKNHFHKSEVFETF